VLIRTVRQFFTDLGYLEVETPHLIPAPAPEVHIDAVGVDNAFLHTSPEICMKRLLAAGYPKIFQICRTFRRDERGGQHLPEFTLLEWYRAGWDYLRLMDECEEMICFIARELGQGDHIVYQGQEIFLQRPWDRLLVSQAFEQYAGLSMDEALNKNIFDQVMVEKIEPGLNRSRPTFLYDYPAPLAALSRLKPGQTDLAERFELYLGGLEIANAFSELTDSIEQEKRFHHEIETRRKLGKTIYPLPRKFLTDLRHMPPSAGIALGVDRLVMLFADQALIDNVVAFTCDEL
jgi:lysyl-tRNA synthetase class 2